MLFGLIIDYKLSYWVGMILKMRTWFKLLEGNRIMFNPLALIIRLPTAIVTCSADGELIFMNKHLLLADRD